MENGSGRGHRPLPFDRVQAVETAQGGMARAISPPCVGHCTYLKGFPEKWCDTEGWNAADALWARRKRPARRLSGKGSVLASKEVEAGRGRTRISLRKAFHAALLLTFEQEGQTTNDGTQWFRDARYGMFIHYGLYSLVGRGEWAMNREHIPVRDYARLAERFTAEKFDADDLIRRGRDWGMRYAVLTTKRHEGFCLYDSSLTDFTSAKTAARRDLVRRVRCGLPEAWSQDRPVPFPQRLVLLA